MRDAAAANRPEHPQVGPQGLQRAMVPSGGMAAGSALASRNSTVGRQAPAGARPACSYVFDNDAEDIKTHR